MRRLFRAKTDPTQGGKSIFQQQHQRILDIILKALNHEYSKVVSEGLRVAGSFVYVLRGQDGSSLNQSFVGIVPSLYAAIREKLQKTDID